MHPGLKKQIATFKGNKTLIHLCHLTSMLNLFRIRLTRSLSLKYLCIEIVAKPGGKGKNLMKTLTC